MQATSPLSENYILREDFAAERGVSVRTIKRDETLRRGPRPIRIGNRCYYKKADIAAWLERLADQRNGGG